MHASMKGKTQARGTFAGKTIKENPTYFQACALVAGPNTIHFHFKEFKDSLGWCAQGGGEGWEDERGLEGRWRGDRGGERNKRKSWKEELNRWKWHRDILFARTYRCLVTSLFKERYCGDNCTYCHGSCLFWCMPEHLVTISCPLHPTIGWRPAAEGVENIIKSCDRQNIPPLLQKAFQSTGVVCSSQSFWQAVILL